jgi:phosphoribosyl-ATP pyrophosphohydrolase
MTFSLEELNTRVADRAGASPDESYTAKLLADGIGEEAVEAVVAAVSKDKPGLTGEAADVLYHLLVLLRAGGVSLDDVMAQLERRTRQSGLAEKASRTP